MRHNLQGLVASVEDLVAAIAAHAPGISLQDLTLHPNSRPTGNQRRKFVVWKASSFGCQVNGGTISLLPDCILLLNGHGAHFRDTTFSGVMLLQLYMLVISNVMIRCISILAFQRSWHPVRLLMGGLAVC